jgi:hypothetical protein
MTIDVFYRRQLVLVGGLCFTTVMKWCGKEESCWLRGKWREWRCEILWGMDLVPSSRIRSFYCVKKRAGWRSSLGCKTNLLVTIVDNAKCLLNWILRPEVWAEYMGWVYNDTVLIPPLAIGWRFIIPGCGDRYLSLHTAGLVAVVEAKWREGIVASLLQHCDAYFVRGSYSLIDCESCGWYDLRIQLLTFISVLWFRSWNHYHYLCEWACPAGWNMWFGRDPFGLPECYPMLTFICACFRR